MFRGLSLTLGAWAVGALALRATVAAPEGCPPIDEASAAGSAAEAARWLVQAQQPDGSYLYEYDRDEGAPVPGYNVVRHAGVTMSLFQYAAATGEIWVLPAAERGLDWMIGNTESHETWQALADPADGSIRLGASALMLASLEQRKALGDGRHDQLMRAVARFLVGQQLPDGGMLERWDRATGEPDPIARSKYATGEAFWALAVMHRFFPGEGWDRAASKTADYLALRRDEVEDQPYPPWADQWAAYGLAEMADWPLEEHHVDYARRLAERFGFLVRVESQRTHRGPWRLFQGPRSRAAGTGTWSEALDSLWRLSGKDHRLADLHEDLGERAVCVAGILRDRQVTTGGREEAGAWFQEGRTRMDDQQHALSGLAYVLPILREGGR